MTFSMTFNRRHITIAAAGILALTFSAAPAMANTAKVEDMGTVLPAIAQNFTPQSFDNRTTLLAQRKVSASDAKSIARRRVPGGEVVDISKSGNDWRVRVIRKDGRVVDVLIDGATGRVKN